MRIALLCLAGLATGCSIIMPADRAVIHSHYLNAVATNVKVQAITTPTAEDWAAVKTWWNAEVATWVWLDDWSRGVKPQVDAAGNPVVTP